VSTGKEATLPGLSFGDNTGSGIRFSPDDGYVVVEGFADDSSMGFTVYDVASNEPIRSVPASQADGLTADIPLWWTDSHTIVYQAVDSSGTASGHRFDVTTGAIIDYPLELGAPVLVLG
jgi:hypothetical protein